MEMKILATFLCFLIMAIIKKSDAVECYQCGSLLERKAECEDPFPSSSVQTVTCNGGCVKIKEETGDTQLVVRTCMENWYAEGCESQENMDQGFILRAGTHDIFKGLKEGVNQHACVCIQDLCNTAVCPVASTFTIVIAVFVGLFYKLRYF